MTRSIEFRTVDVFTTRRFEGNPLAVFPDASALTAAQMQALAAEMNLSETTFVLPPRDPGHTARIRIFTPRTEVPFAGHPNVGTAYVLARLGRAGGETLSFEEPAGDVAVRLVRNQAGEVVGATVRAPQPLEIRQGREVGRPSVIRASAERSRDGILASIGGDCVEVFRGEMLLET